MTCTHAAPSGLDGHNHGYLSRVGEPVQSASPTVDLHGTGGLTVCNLLHPRTRKMNPTLPTKLLKLIVLMLTVGAVIVGTPSRADDESIPFVEAQAKTATNLISAKTVVSVAARVA